MKRLYSFLVWLPRFVMVALSGLVCGYVAADCLGLSCVWYVIGGLA